MEPCRRSMLVSKICGGQGGPERELRAGEAGGALGTAGGCPAPSEHLIWVDGAGDS